MGKKVKDIIIRGSSYEDLCNAFGKEEVDKNLNKAREEVINKYYTKERLKDFIKEKKIPINEESINKMVDFANI